MHPLNKSWDEIVSIIQAVLPRHDCPHKFTLLCKVLTGGRSTYHGMLSMVGRQAKRESQLVGP